MQEYTVDPKVELRLYFSMLIVSSVFLPIGVNIVFAAPIKATILIGSVFLLAGSVSFVACSNVWTFLAMQSVFTTVGSCMFQLVALLLAWDWFSPTIRGLVTGLVVSFQLLTMAAIISAQIGIVENGDLSPT